MTDRTIIERLERLERAARLGVTPLAATDADGNPSPVAAGELIEASWGNAVVDHVVKRFADETALATWAAPNGALAVTTDTGTIWQRFGGAWTRNVAGMIGYVQAPSTDQSISAASLTIVNGLESSLNITNGRRYRVDTHFSFQVSASETVTCYIYEATTTSYLARGDFYRAGAGGTVSALTSRTFVAPWGGARHFLTFVVCPVAGIVANTLSPGWLTIEEI
jgi:hypothetical protein